MLTLETCPRPAPGAVGRLLEDEAVVVLPGQGRVKVLNEVGARIWSLIDGRRTVGDIVTAVCAEYEIERAVAEADTLAFLAELAEHGAVTLSPTTSREP